MDSLQIENAVDDLQKAFCEFKSINDERLKSIEVKGGADPLLSEKLDRLNQHLDETQGRLKRLEAAHGRPQLGGALESSCSHKSAFMGYVRKGDTGELEAKGLSSRSDKEGGYLIPQEIAQDIIQTIVPQSPMRQVAKVLTITSDALEILVDKDDLDAGWAQETGDRPETATPEWARIRIPVHEMYARPRATQKLLDDSEINLEAWLSGKIASRMASLENQAFIYGDGVGKPKGFLSYETASRGNWSWGKLEAMTTGVEGDFGDHGADQLIDLLNLLKPQYMQGAVWMMPRSAQARIRKLKDSATGQYLWQPGLNGETSPTLMGYPVILADDMPALTQGTESTSVAFGNFKEAYSIIDRQGTQILRDPFSAKPYVEFYTTRRVGGDIVNFEALKVLKFGA